MTTWRDIGGGRVKCDDTGRTGTLTTGHHVIIDGQDDRSVRFSSREWAKLRALAIKRATTPRAVLRAFVQGLAT